MAVIVVVVVVVVVVIVVVVVVVAVVVQQQQPQKRAAKAAAITKEYQLQLQQHTTINNDHKTVRTFPADWPDTAPSSAPTAEDAEHTLLK